MVLVYTRGERWYRRELRPVGRAYSVSVATVFMRVAEGVGNFASDSECSIGKVLPAEAVTQALFKALPKVRHVGWSSTDRVRLA